MELYESPKQINGISLKDYYPNQRSFNSVVYVHKSCLAKPKKENKEEKVKKIKDKKPKKKKKSKCDKCEQCDDLDCNPGLVDINNTMLAQSLHYAKTLVPLLVPQSGTASPVYYTIKTSKKKDTKKKPKEEVLAHTHTLKKEKSKRVVETYRHHAGKESLSVKETISYSHSSQSDTLNELQINPSLCCSFSEISDHKQVRREKRDKQKDGAQKLVPSESFEALATEFLNTTGETKIKIHLMNETEKNLLSENIRVPVLNAIRDCISEMNIQKDYTGKEMATVHRYVKCNTEKLDCVLEKLTCIEQKFDHYIDNESKKRNYYSSLNELRKDKIPPSTTVKVIKPRTPKMQLSKSSTLDEDILELTEQNPIAGLELKDESSSDVYFPRAPVSARQKQREKLGDVLQLEANEQGDNQLNMMSVDGEDRNHATGLVKPERTDRVPARFCWTGAGVKRVP